MVPSFNNDIVITVAVEVAVHDRGYVSSLILSFFRCEEIALISFCKRFSVAKQNLEIKSVAVVRAYEYVSFAVTVEITGDCSCQCCIAVCCYVKICCAVTFIVVPREQGRPFLVRCS